MPRTTYELPPGSTPPILLRPANGAAFVLFCATITRWYARFECVSWGIELGWHVLDREPPSPWSAADRLENRHRGVVTADAADSAGAYGTRTAQQNISVAGIHAPASGRAVVIM